MKFKNLVIIIPFLFVIAFSMSACTKHEPQLRYIPHNGVILAFGDSLTYGSGAAKNHSYPTILSSLINRKVINAGFPGMMSAEGTKRIVGLINIHRPLLVILCLGGNDLLRRVKWTSIAINLDKIIHTALLNRAQVVLIGVPAPGLSLSPPKFYKTLAQKYDIPLDNNSLSELESNPKYKSDSIHLNAEGYRILAKNIAQLLKRSGAIN